MGRKQFSRGISRIGVDKAVSSIDAEQLFNAKDNNRPLFLQSDKTVTVNPSGGADYSSLQTAVDNEFPYIFVNSRITFDLADGTYGEDVTLPEAYGRWSGGYSVVIDGNSTTPSNVNGLSIGIDSCEAGIKIQFTQIDRESPLQSENSGIVAFNSGMISVKEVVFGNITIGVTSYGADEVQVQEVEFGTNLTTAVQAKHGGYAVFQSVGASNITGTTTGDALQAWNGIIRFHSDSSLSGSPLAHATQGHIMDETGKVLAGMNTFPPENRLTILNNGSIQDEAGQDRMKLTSDSTRFYNSGGNDKIFIFSGVTHYAHDGEDITVWDKQAGGVALKYVTAASLPGDLDLGGARLKNPQNNSTTADSMTANPESTTEDGYIEVDIGGTIYQIPIYSS